MPGLMGECCPCIHGYCWSSTSWSCSSCQSQGLSPKAQHFGGSKWFSTGFGYGLDVGWHWQAWSSAGDRSVSKSVMKGVSSTGMGSIRRRRSDVRG